MGKGNSTISFRIESEHLAILRKEAERRDISLNTLASQIFCSFVEWDIHAAEAGWLVLRKSIAKELFDLIEDAKLTEMAEAAAREAEGLFLIMSGTYDIDVFYSIMRNKARKSGFPLVEEDTEHGKKFITQHDMGRKWSLFFKTYYEEILHGFKCKAMVEATGNSLIVEVWNR